MPFKDPEIQKQVQHEWYLKNKRKLIDRQREDRREARRKFLEYKKTLKCERCPESHPACLDFHHKDPKEKEIGISEAINFKWSLKRLKKEIDKCNILCANCHRKEHFDLNEQWTNGKSPVLDTGHHESSTLSCST